MTIAIIIVVVVVLLVLAAIGGYLYQGQRLRRRFGPEYDRMLETKGSRFRAEQELRGREKRHDSLTLRDLTPEARDRYAEEWRRIQAQFVDDPGAAATQADALITRIMTDRGYPTGQFDQRAADLSVEHATTVDRYRRAHDLTISHHQGTADTEDLRHALVDYRALVTDLLGTNPVPPNTTPTATTGDTTTRADTATRDEFADTREARNDFADARGTRDEFADAGTRDAGYAGRTNGPTGTTAAGDPVEPRSTTARDTAVTDADVTGETGDTVGTGETVGTAETDEATQPVRKARKTTSRRHEEAR